MTADVVTLARKGRNMPEYDPIFFPKEAIDIGTLLTNYGKRDPGSKWKVTDIRTYVKKPTGFYHLEKASEVKHLGDIITLVRVPSDPAFVSRREPTFGSLSYSAIWRLS
jgi:hypothetical protein